MVRTIAFAPGRVNLIGDHTDYTGGLVLPMAIQLGTTVSMDSGGSRFRVSSDNEPEPADLPLSIADTQSVTPVWARYLAGVINQIGPSEGGSARVTTTLPIGAGLSSSAALEVAAALALGFVGSPLELAHLCQLAEHEASGVPCGIMDQLASVSGVEGCALLIDCQSESIQPVPIPPDCEVVAVHSGQARTLATSDYGERRQSCEHASSLIGALRDAQPSDLTAISDLTIRKRARHVVTENARVSDFVTALCDQDLAGAGDLMLASHASLRDDFGVSTPALDALVEDLSTRPGVFGARLTGAGFGGCVVALTEPGAVGIGWKLVPSAGARLVEC